MVNSNHVECGYHLALILCLAACACSGGGLGDGWTAERLSTRAEFDGVFFLDAERGFIVGGDYFIDGGIIGSTSDGGTTWDFQSGLVKAKPGFHLTDVVFLDRFVGIAVGTHGVILRTTDRGRHWHVVRPFSGGTDHLLDVTFIDELHGWAVGFSGIVHTTDGGQNWSRLGPPRTISGSAVHFHDLLQGVVVGKHGRINLTADGGETWTEVSDPDRTGTADLLDLSFVGPFRGWTVGTEGTILNTSDGGRTWRRQESGVRSRLIGINLVDPNRGWIVGADRETSSSILLHTRDGGMTWGSEGLVEGELLRAVFFSDPGHGWAVGEKVEHGPQALLRYRSQ